MGYSAYIVCLLMMIAVIPGILITSAQQEHDVRLSDVGGKQGRVEVFNNGEWGTVCREGWDFYDALVTCRQLGFWWIAISGWAYNAGDNKPSVWLSNVGCLGSETSLEQCSNDGWFDHECTGPAAGVSCLHINELGAAGQFLGEAQLGNGFASVAEGNVGFKMQTESDDSVPRERFLISDEGWDMADAEVVCRQMGYHSAARATLRSYFGKWQSDDPPKYLASEFACHGNESLLLQCPAKDWFPVDPPSDWREAGAICNRREEPEGFQIRLVNGTTSDEGRIEVFINGAWGSICRKSSQQLSYLETNVICGQLGLGYGKETPKAGQFGRSSLPVAMTGNIGCEGSEPSLAQCDVTLHVPELDICDKLVGSFDASVICSGPIPESRSPIRFPYLDTIGAVLIYHDGVWGSICDVGWTMANAQVVCRELGQGPPLQAMEPDTASGIEGPIFLEGGGIMCNGDEATLDQCTLGQWSQQQANCDHSMDVTVLCTPRPANAAGRPISAKNTIIVTSLTALYCMLLSQFH